MQHFKLKKIIAVFSVVFLGLSLPSTASAWCWWNCNYTKTKYPIVLSHGILGFDSILGGSVSYWHRIEDDLEDRGAEVYVTQVAAAGLAETRGESIIAQLEEIRAIKGDPDLKFNLIGHSMGGYDVRYVAGTRPDLVASVTAIATPHPGIDIELVETVRNLDEGVINTLNNLLQDAYCLLGASCDPVDFGGAIEQVSVDFLANFNAQFPGGVPATYCGSGEAVTQTAAGPIRNYSWTGDHSTTNFFDITDPIFGLVGSLYDERNDGFVEACAAHFGVVLRDDYRMNHFDQVNNLWGIVALFETNPKTLFRNHANRLKNAGL